MKWPVLFIGVVLVLGVVIFAMSYGIPASHTESKATTTQSMLPTPLITNSSGVMGAVRTDCDLGSADAQCLPQIRVIQAYQGASSVGLFKTALDGTFRGELPPGQYELRVDTPTTTRCASVGIVIPESSFVATNISCKVTK